MTKQVFGLLTLAMLDSGLGPTAHAASCDPVIEGQYGRGLDAAVYSSCTTDVSRLERTVAIKYNPGGYIDTVVDSLSAYTPDAPASTASIGTLTNFYSQDMGPGYIGDCRTMKGKLNATPTAVSGNFYCFRFEGSSADLYLGASYNSLFDSLSRGTASIVFPATANDFVTTWQTDNPGTSSSTSITVPMSGGPYDVDWNNDETFDELGISGAVTHDFGAAGTYTIRIRGSYDYIKFNNGGDKEKIISLDQWGTNTWTTMRAAFFGAVNLTVPATDAPDLSALTDLSSMFKSASSANPDTSGWNTSQVTDMSVMFDFALLANPDTSGWDTSLVTNMWSMFDRAASANPDTSNWITSQVTDMSTMFRGATSANPDTSGWDTSLVTTMNSMFNGATLANPDTSGWNMSRVESTRYMFNHATSANPDVSGWNTSAVTTMAYMFAFADSANPDVSGWDTSKVTDMSYMFFGAHAFDRNIGLWDVSELIDAAQMFTAVTLSTPNYDSLLVGWDAQILKPGVVFDGGNSTYCSEAATTARANMTASDGWVITDGGQSCATFSVGGNVSGLSGNGLVLQNNTGDDLAIAADGGFTFSTALVDGSAYAVTVKTQPSNPAQTCSVSNGSGKLAGFNITNVEVTCVTVLPFMNHFVTTWQTDNPGTSSSTSITVPMSGGPYDVDWNNDETFDELGISGAVTHDFGAAGTHTIRIRGTYDSIQFSNGGDKEKIISLDQWGNNTWTTMNYAFYGAANLTIPATDTPDFSEVTSMRGMFFEATLANPDTSWWDTSSVKLMENMFNGATYASPDTSRWDTSSVTLMGGMFHNARSANPNTSNWDTSSVTYMESMFRGADSADPDTSNWDTSLVTTMASMFYVADLANPNTSNWDTSSVTSMSQMFWGAELADPDTSNWDTSKVTNMSSMFRIATSANPVTSNWNTSKVTSMSQMFRGATSANPDTTNWDTSSVTSMSSMFNGASSANPNTTNWDTSSVIYMSSMFAGVTAANLDVSSWDTSLVEYFDYMFSGATAANPDVSNWDTSSGIGFNGVFKGATAANPDVSSWDTSSVIRMSLMFSGATSFDRDIGSWNVTMLTDATDMFSGVTLSTANYDSLLVGWNAQVLQPGVTFSGGNSVYCADPAIAARDNMIASDGWVITDGGQSCSVVGEIMFSDGFE